MTAEESMAAGVRESFREFASDPAVQRGMRELAAAERDSHLAQGDAHLREGRYRPAIEAYRQDLDLEITTYGLASVVERACCHMGDAYRVLGELDRAAEAYSAALALWRTYGYGEMPAASLAAVYVEQGRVDEAIAVCEEYMPEGGDAAIRQVLEEARRRQAGGAPSPVRGCRLVHLPFRHPGEPPPQRGVAPADG